MGRRRRLLTQSAAVLAAVALAVSACSDDSGDDAPSETTADTSGPTSTVGSPDVGEDGTTSSGGSEGAVDEADVDDCRERIVELIEGTGEGITLGEQAQLFADFDEAGCNEVCGDIQDPESRCRPE
jgi:hypothetical protein